jgi:hypothetical protein
MPAYLCTPKNERPVRLRVRTPPFHGGDTSSNLVRATKRESKSSLNGWLFSVPFEKLTRFLSAECLQKYYQSMPGAKVIFVSIIFIVLP